MTLSDPCALSDLCPGVKNLAVQMSDPFGNDPVDFKLENFLASYYNNAIHFLADDFDSNGDDLPEGIQNPMDSRRGARKRISGASPFPLPPTLWQRPRAVRAVQGAVTKTQATMEVTTATCCPWRRPHLRCRCR